MRESENRYDQLESLKTSFSNKEPFKLPDNYFENLNQKVLQATEEYEQPAADPAPRVTMWTRLRPIVYMAAMFASLFLIIKYVVGDNGSKNGNSEYADRQSSEIEVLHDYMASTVDEYSIYESYQEYNNGSSVPVYEASYTE